RSSAGLELSREAAPREAFRCRTRRSGGLAGLGRIWLSEPRFHRASRRRLEALAQIGRLLQRVPWPHRSIATAPCAPRDDLGTRDASPTGRAARRRQILARGRNEQPSPWASGRG